MAMLHSLIARRWIWHQTPLWPRPKAIHFSWLGPELSSVAVTVLSAYAVPRHVAVLTAIVKPVAVTVLSAYAVPMHVAVLTALVVPVSITGSGTVRSKTSSSRDDSSGTFRSKFRTGLFAPKWWNDSLQNKFTGRFTHFHNIHVYLLKIKF